MVWTLEKARRVVRERAGGRCERCGTALRDDWSCHHRRPRGMGGTRRFDANSPANLLALCGSATTGCHGEVESDREAARGTGWLVRLNADPALIPVPIFGRDRLTYLTDDGGYRDVGVSGPEGEGVRVVSRDVLDVATGGVDLAALLLAEERSQLLSTEVIHPVHDGGATRR